MYHTNSKKKGLGLATDGPVTQSCIQKEATAAWTVS